MVLAATSPLCCAHGRWRAVAVGSGAGRGSQDPWGEQRHRVRDLGSIGEGYGTFMRAVFAGWPPGCHAVGYAKSTGDATRAPDVVPDEGRARSSIVRHDGHRQGKDDENRQRVSTQLPAAVRAHRRW